MHQTALAEVPTVPRDTLRGMRVLIIDDEPTNCTLLRHLLTEGGFTCLELLTDSRKALNAIRTWRPDVILLDLMMPWLDGFGVMQQLAAEIDPGEFLPVMVLTADNSEVTRKRALAAGATDFLTKPFDRTECVLRLTNLLATRRLHLQLAAQNEMLEQRVKERTAALEDALAELRTAQQHVVQRERLSALGSMVTGVAHDFNNSLAHILGFAERLQHEVRAPGIPGSMADCAQNIVTATLDATESVGRLSNFHRPASPGETRQPVVLGEIVEQAIEFTRPRWEAESHARAAPIDVHRDCAARTPIAGNAAELREMLTNLIFNAVDALPQGGGITVRTRTAGECLVLEVSDTGTGMTEEVRRRCLEPFFTTKGSRSSGLGLAMVYGIVQRHDGSIVIDSGLGRGTRFIITFPVDHSCAAAPPATPAQPAHPLRILVVDDQPVLCEILAETLARDWHEVTTANHGRTAIEKFGFGNFDLVITDKAMPEMNGDQLAAAVKSRAPETRVIMLTGFGDLNAGDEGVSEFIDCVLTKPATTATLRSAIAKVMSRATP
jgi:signal transduction histidine kinase